MKNHIKSKFLLFFFANIRISNTFIIHSKSILCIFFIIIFINSCTSKKPSREYNTNGKISRKKNKIDYSLSGFKKSDRSLEIERSAIEEIKYASKEKNIQDIELNIKILSLITFDDDISKFINKLSKKSFSDYKYFTGEGFGLITSLYLYQGFSLQELKWDFYKLRQALVKKDLKVFSQKGIILFDQIILKKFINIKLKNKNQFLIIPECSFNENNKHYQLYKKLYLYFKFFTQPKSNIQCRSHLSQIKKFMSNSKKIRIDFYYLSHKQRLSAIISNYIGNLNIKQFKNVKYIDD